MDIANLLDQRAELIADQSNPQEVMAALRSVDEINTEQQEMLDWVLTDWVMTVLSRPADLEGVVEMHTLCRLAQSSLDESESAPNFAQRWEGYADLLEGKRLALRDRIAPPILELLQEPKILARLVGGEVRQADFTEFLNISAGRVSQVLALLESRGKITRVRRGKESWVMLAPGMVAGNAGSMAEPVAANEAGLRGLGSVRSATAAANDSQVKGLGRNFLTAEPTPQFAARH
jgi:hypothetical protein